MKNGKTKAYIEIELQMNEQGETVVFNRSFDKAAVQTFKIDGEKVSEKNFIERVRTFNIQVDNLCMFLPQDRVQDFTKLNSQELLHNTQISVCSPAINEAFENLKKKRDLQKNSAKTNSEIQTQLEDNLNRNDQLHAMIENSRAREKLVEQRELHLKKKAWLEFDDLKAKFDEADADVKRLQESIARKKTALVPLEKVQRETVGKRTALKNAISNSATKGRQNQDQVDKMLDSIRNVNSEIRESRQKLKNVCANARMHAQEVRELGLKIELDKNELEKAKQELQNGANEEVIRDLDGKIAHFKAQIEGVFRKVQEISYQMDEQVTPAIEASKRKIGSMNDTAKKRLGNLRSSFEDAYQAYQWLEHNRDNFKGRIFNPIIMEITVSEAKYAKYLENTIGMRDFEMFLCTEKEDVAKLVKIFRTEMRLKVNVGFIEDSNELQFVPQRSIESFPKNQGVYAYLIQMIEGPIPVLNYLCKLYRLHNVVVGDNRIENHASQLPPDVRLFFSSDSRFNVVTSRYTGKKSITSNKIHPRKLLDVGVDTEGLQREQEM